jgi:hypothetical protein
MRRSGIRRASAALLLLLLAAACRPEEPAAPDVVARIEGEEIRYAEVERYVERTAGDGESVLASDVLSQLFDQFLDEELLWRLAAGRNLVEEGTADTAAARRRAIDALLAADLGEGPDEREIAAYYEAHRAELTRPERVRVRQILTEDRATAERALRELSGGADFTQVARALSDGPGAASGGYQGELSRADLPPAFADVLFSLRPGEVSRLIPADYGFHIFQVVARSPAGVIPLAEARAQIEERLRQQRADRLLAELVAEARRRYNVEVHARNLPFEYRGSYERDAKNP